MGTVTHRRRSGGGQGGRAAVGVGLAVALTIAAGPAAADDGVAAAQEAWTALDYETCVASAKQALNRPGSREERVDAYRLLGLCEAALGDTAEARSAFVKMLGVDRDAELPGKLSPRFTSSFLEAKGEWLDRPSTGFVIEEDAVDGSRRTLRLQVSDALGLLREVAWRTEDGEVHDATRVAERMELVVPKDVAKELVGFDEKGGVIVVQSLAPKEAPGPERGLATPDPADAGETDVDEGSSILTSPWLWLGAAAVGGVIIVGAAAGAGIGFALYEPRSVDMTGSVVFADQE